MVASYTRLIGLFAVASLMIPVGAVSAASTDADIERCIMQLGNEEFAKREMAGKELVDIGEPARAALERAAATDQDKEIRYRAAALIKAIDAKRMVLCYDLHSEMVLGLEFTPDGRQIISASRDGTVRLFESASGRLVHCFAHPSAFSVAISPDGKKAISGGYGPNQDLRLWNLETGRELQRFTAYQGSVYGLAFSPDGKQVILGACDDKTVRLLDLDSGEEKRRLVGHTEIVTSIALSADGRQCLSGSHDATARLWDVGTGQEIRRFAGEADQGAVALSRDGKRGASGGSGELIHLWNLETGAEIRQLRNHVAGVNWLVFSNDGRRLASANYEGRTVSIWNTETGQELHRFEGHTDKVRCVAFSPDGRFLASGGFDKAVRVWRVPE
jgi:WD40 repeat protein